MVDWNKPIETTDGRKVTVLMLNAVHAGFTESKPVAIVKIEGDHRGKNGLYSTYRMDGVAPLNPDVPKIRNVSTKREGWVLRRPLESIEGDCSIITALAVSYVFSTEEEAKKAMKYYTMPDGVVPVHVQWEE